jgi:dolichol-phosphate mannosyltransferase
MARDIPKLSLVCPAYQEEQVLPYFHDALTRVLDTLDGQYEIEILYVDDGSRDRTLTVLRDLARHDARVRYLSLSRNFGHQAALTAGLEHASGDVVISLDSDLQHPPALVPRLLARWKDGYDIVLTVRQDDPDLGLFKRYSSRCFYWVMGFLSDTDIRLSAADYRLMSRKAVDALLQLRESHRFLRGMVQWLGFPVAEVPFRPAARKAGVSKYTVRKMMNLAIDGMLSFSKLPLRGALFLGLLAVALGLVTACAAGAMFWQTRGEIGLGWPAVLVCVQLLGGCILFAVGVLGEYVGRIYEQVKGRPLYLLKDQSPAYAAGHGRGEPEQKRTLRYGGSAEEGQTAA